MSVPVPCPAPPPKAPVAVSSSAPTLPVTPGAAGSESELGDVVDRYAYAYTLPAQSEQEKHSSETEGAGESPPPPSSAEASADGDAPAASAAAGDAASVQGGASGGAGAGAGDTHTVGSAETQPITSQSSHHRGRLSPPDVDALVDIVPRMAAPSSPGGPDSDEEAAFMDRQRALRRGTRRPMAPRGVGGAGVRSASGRVPVQLRGRRRVHPFASAAGGPRSRRPRGLPGAVPIHAAPLPGSSLPGSSRPDLAIVDPKKLQELQGLGFPLASCEEALLHCSTIDECVTYIFNLQQRQARGTVAQVSPPPPVPSASRFLNPGRHRRHANASHEEDSRENEDEGEVAVNMSGA